MSNEITEMLMRAPTKQRTEKGLAYEKWIKHVKRELSGMSSKQQKRLAKLNKDFMRGLDSPRYGASHRAELDRDLKAITPSSVHVDTLLAQISIRYANDEYIGERLMPPVRVGKRSNLYVVYPKRERFGYPDDEIGYRSSPNELEESRERDSYSVRDYGYKNFLDTASAENQDQPFNEMVELVEAINEGIAFKRELRIFSIVGVTGSYGTNTANAGTNWNDSGPPSGGSIIDDVNAAIAALWSGRNQTQKIGFCGISVWNQGIANNAALHELFKYVQSGQRTMTQVANFFGLDDILVTRSRQDTANIGQTASYSRMLAADVFGVLSVATNPTRNSLHFGSTFRLSTDPFTSEWEDPSIGSHGGIWSRVTVSEDHKIVAPDAGFLIDSILT